MLRLPAFAGSFYPNEANALARQVASLCPRSAFARANGGADESKTFPDIVPHGVPNSESRRHSAIACLVPHAGYRFSGRVAGSVYAGLELPQRFLLIGPRHYARGRDQAILSEGSWQTPLGNVEIDSGLAGELKRACPALAEDEVAHREEHAIEVQLPFLQCLAGRFRFVPIALGTLDYGQLEALGQAMAAVVARQEGLVLIVASSDMNHYESDEITRRKDGMALDRLLGLDPRGLYDIVRREGITMCGMGPVVSMLIAARLLGASRSRLVRYATSGDVLGDTLGGGDEVVGYAGVVVN